MAKCPVCSTRAINKVPNSPYWACPSCDCWFQHPLPPKVYEADHEKDANGGYAGHLMSDHDKEINAKLAAALSEVLPDNSNVLDIGSKYPYLAHCFKNLGHNAFGIDGIDIVPEYSKELGVPMLCADFEAMKPEDLQTAFGVSSFNLITMIHVFEHMYNPLQTLRVLKSLLAPDGIVFLRLPDHSISGFERDMTPGHFDIHPFFHCLGSMTELLYQGKDLFTIAKYRPMIGFGQSDYILRPINRKPIVYAGMIVKNEEKHLPICLESIAEVVDGAVIVDTGSVDRTPDIVRSWSKFPVWYSKYLEASEQDEKGDWKLWDFSKARNQFVDKIDAKKADYVLWMDADDRLLTPQNLRRALYLDEYEIFGIKMRAGPGPSWIHHRLWKANRGIHFAGAIHEYPTIQNHIGLHLDDSIIFHDAEPTATESSNDRNMRILKRELEKDPTSTRTTFYIANTYADSNDKATAAIYYQKRIDLGVGYKDEYLFAHLYLARCLKFLDRQEEAVDVLWKALAVERTWSEFWMELAFTAYNSHKWWECISFCLQAATKSITTTQLWREEDKYRDQPCRILSWAYEHLGNKKESLFWAQKAQPLIQEPDQEWEDRIIRLNKKSIALLRPGAIGDIIMILNLMPEFRKANPDADIHFFCNEKIGNELREFAHACGVNQIRKFEDINVCKGWFDQIINLVGYPLNEGYPNVPMKHHLMHYFANEMGIKYDNGTLSPLEVEWSEMPCATLPLPKRLVEGEYATIHPKAGWSMYKNWPIERWAEVVAACDFPVYQIGTADDPKVPGANHSFMGQPLETAIALIANAKIHMGVDSFTNHLTNVEWLNVDNPLEPPRTTPAVILWGSTQYNAAGYSHNTNISLGLQCQPCFKEDPKISRMSQGICMNPPGQTYEAPQHACMMGITVDRVKEEVLKLWREA